MNQRGHRNRKAFAEFDFAEQILNYVDKKSINFAETLKQSSVKIDSSSIITKTKESLILNKLQYMIDYCQPSQIVSMIYIEYFTNVFGSSVMDWKSMFPSMMLQLLHNTKIANNLKKICQFMTVCIMIVQSDPNEALLKILLNLLDFSFLPIVCGLCHEFIIHENTSKLVHDFVNELDDKQLIFQILGKSVACYQATFGKSFESFTDFIDNVENRVLIKFGSWARTLIDNESTELILLIVTSSIVGFCRTNRLDCIKDLSIKFKDTVSITMNDIEHGSCSAIANGNMNLYLLFVWFGAKAFEKHKKVASFLSPQMVKLIDGLYSHQKLFKQTFDILADALNSQKDVIHLYQQSFNMIQSAANENNVQPPPVHSFVERFHQSFVAQSFHNLLESHSKSLGFDENPFLNRSSSPTDP